MAPPPNIVELVEHFGRNADVYRSNLNETEVRVQFIDPFFEALGWDIHNKQHYAETYKDVLHEYTLRTGPHTEAPDYCFQVGGTRKFFVEAKRPAVNIGGDPASAFQLRSYAWTSKLSISFLTNFAELSVYDCRIEPHASDKASVARIDLIPFDKYVEQWDNISSRFSKEAVYKGSFDRYTETSKLKKGTAEVDDAFLAEIEAWRKDLAANIATRNPTLSQRELNFAVQRTIDRIIFLRICEDRGIEKYGQLQELQYGDGVYHRLCTIYERADEKYNSGLFHFTDERDRAEAPDKLTPNLKVDDGRLKAIFKRLYYPESPYKFSHFPADILGHVYEQFLGQVIRLTSGHHARIEQKPEVKKAGGVYYTPTYVVDFIVKRTVGKVLEGKTPRAVGRIRIVDPACGSGSFLLGAYQYLMNWHRDWYLQDGADKNVKFLFKTEGGDWRLTTSEKKRILLNSIYGVDIDAQAVEVTKLSLLLKVLEGENDQTLGNTLRLFHERALPDLGNNVKCGNSLIGSDFYLHQQLLLIDDEERFRINVFDWSGSDGFQSIMKTGGFDVVIGNPPWGGDIDKELEYFHDRFPATTKDHTDSFKLFIEAGIRLAKNGGIVSMIVPSTILRQRRLRDVRELLLGNAILSLVDLGEDVFKGVVAPSCIYVVQKGKPQNGHIVEIRDISRVTSLERPSLLLPTTTKNDAVVEQALLGQNAELELAQRVVRSHGPVSILGDMVEFKCKDGGINYQRVRVGMRAKGNSDLADRLLYEGKQQRVQDQMFWKGSDIGTYWVSKNTQRFCRPDVKTRSNEVVHMNRGVYKTVPKILLRQTADTIVAAMDYRGIWFGRSIIAIVKESGNYRLEYLLGLLNSRFLRH
jgi:type I restriction-modification system DNA methylase subunit